MMTIIYREVCSFPEDPVGPSMTAESRKPGTG